MYYTRLDLFSPLILAVDTDRHCLSHRPTFTLTNDKVFVVMNACHTIVFIKMFYRIFGFILSPCNATMG